MQQCRFDQEYQQTQAVLGKVLSADLDASRSPLGTVGKYRAYESGTIYQTNQYGAVAVSRDSQREYSEHGASGGWLGFPTKHEYSWNGGKRVDFEGGYIYSNGLRAIAYDIGAAPSTFLGDSGNGSTANWSISFWNNQSLSGNPTWSRTDSAGELRFEAAGVPANTIGVPADRFSARWTTNSFFDGGLYDFVSQADDGVRVYVDGVKILDRWQDQPFMRNDSYALIAKGRHTVQVDYFENLGNAVNTLRWDPLGPLSNWTGGIQIVGFDGTNVHGTYTNTFVRDGGGVVLGAPIDNVHPWGNGYVQDFSGGTEGAGIIMKSNANDNSYWIGGSFWNSYLTAGGSGGLLGYPVSDRYATNGGFRQDFQGGSILKSAQGNTYPIYGGIGGKYSSLGAQNSLMGFPTSGEIGIGDGWIIQNFEGGHIIYKEGQPTIAYDTKAVNGLPVDSGHGSTANWSVSFWNNQNQSGNPTWSRTDPAGEIRFAAGAGAPVNTRGVQEDHFSARWTTRSYFDGGFYDFVNQADDGIRITIDGIRVIDKWQTQPFVRNDAYVSVGKGFHDIQVDYFEDGGAAANTLRWNALGQAVNWTGAVTPVGFDGASVHGTYNNTFVRSGGASIVGAPINNVHPWGNGYVQDFRGGTEGSGIVMKSNADNSYWIGGSFWNGYLAAGGSGGILGYPTSDRYATNGGFRQDFQGGSLIQSAKGIFPIYGGVGYQYLHFEGGQKGRLGAPTSGEIGIGNGAIVQNFEKGYILYGRGPTRTVMNGSEIAVGYDGAGVNTTYTNTFDRIGGWDVVGSAANNVHRWGNGYVQDFVGGSEGSGIIMKWDVNNNSYWVGGSIWQKFLETGGVGGIMGYPIADRYASNGGFRQDFQGGSIFQSAKGTFPIFGGVGYQYLHYEGGQQGRLGFPTSGEIGIGNGAIVQNFENGYVLYGRGVTRTVINGSEIAIGYDGAGVNTTFTNTFERSGGWAVTGSAANNVHPWANGYTQDFVGGSDGRGSIMKSNANNNSYWVGGDFWNKFLQAGGASGILGYATSDRYSSSIALKQDFQGGSILKTSKGLFALYGGIGGYYFKAAGGEKGALGLPTSGEQGIGNGIIRQDFENGYILWNGSATGYKSNGSLLFAPVNSSNGGGSSFTESPLFANPTTQNPLKGFRHPLFGNGVVTQGPGGATSHDGRAAYAIDFGVPMGTSVYAMRSGKVIAVRDIYPDTDGGVANTDRFNYTLIEHDGGYRSAYLHLQQGFNSRVGLKVGDNVNTGQLIGYSGNSGWSTGPHLHVEVHQPTSGGYFGQTVPFEISSNSVNAISGGTTSGTTSAGTTSGTTSTGTTSGNTSTGSIPKTQLPNPGFIGKNNAGQDKFAELKKIDTKTSTANKPTWIFIHGWNSDPSGANSELANTIEDYSNDDQVFSLDWSSAAKTGLLYFNAATTWISSVATFAVNMLKDWGISPQNVNVVGHSYGAYIAYEISKQFGGIGKLVALDPASTTGNEYTAKTQVNFSQFSQWSWAFSSSWLGSADLAKTADESFSVEFPWANDNDRHGAVVPLWKNMLKEKNGRVSQYFGLEDFQAQNKPWSVDYGTKVEAYIKAKDQDSSWWNADWVADEISYEISMLA
jgi:murein DD-endopeptidase MepM/ murein hydrolase activator NlpD